MSFGDFFKGIAKPGLTLLGGAIAGPAGAGVGNLLGTGVESLFGTDEDSAAAAAMRSNNDLIEALLGYSTPGSRFLEDYTGRVFYDAMEGYKENDLAQDVFKNIFDAVQSGNMDTFTGQQFLASKLSPTSEFYGTDDYAQLLNAKVDSGTQNNVFDQAFRQNFLRDPSDKERKYYLNYADSMGQNKSPMQLASALNSTFANNLEVQGKTLPAGQRRAADYYGTPVRYADGTLTGGYNTFGFPMKSFDSSKLFG